MLSPTEIELLPLARLLRTDRDDDYASYCDRCAKLYWYWSANDVQPSDEREEIVASDPYLADLYAEAVLKRRWHAAEPVILTNPIAAMSYAKDVLHAPWAEAEGMILTSPRASSQYANHVLQRRWPEAERVILKHPWWAAKYAAGAMGERWPEAEPIIAQDGNAAGFYAAYVTKKRWPKVEALIADYGYGSHYAEEVIGGRWTECEDAMLSGLGRTDTDLVHRHMMADRVIRYSQKVIGGRWPGAEALLHGAGKFDDYAKALEFRTPQDGYANLMLEDAFGDLDRLIGLDAVKDELRRLAAYASVQKRRRDQGLRSPGTSLHLVFTGKPGTGKTTVARLVGRIYAALGLLRSGHVVEADRSSFVADYLGQTDSKTKAKIAEATDGVLFIDEAYTLAPPHTRQDYGIEAINALLTEMENNRDRLAVIAAGYSEEMKQFLDSNPGLRSRFSRQIAFEDYSGANMLDIFARMASDHDFSLTEPAREKLAVFFEEAHRQRGAKFGNGRFVRNVFELAVETMSLRCATDLNADLSVLIEEDFGTYAEMDAR